MNLSIIVIALVQKGLSCPSLLMNHYRAAETLTTLLILLTGATFDLLIYDCCVFQDHGEKQSFVLIKTLFLIIVNKLLVGPVYCSCEWFSFK